MAIAGHYIYPSVRPLPVSVPERRRMWVLSQDRGRKSCVRKLVCRWHPVDSSRVGRALRFIGQLQLRNTPTPKAPKGVGIKDAGSTVPLCTAGAKAFVVRLTLFVTLWSITTSWEMRI